MLSRTGMLLSSGAGGGRTGGVEGAVVVEVATLSLSDGNWSRVLNTSNSIEVSGVSTLN